MRPRLARPAITALLAGALATLGGCASSGPASSNFDAARFAPWQSETPAYRLYPGDEVEVRVHTADELSSTLTLGPEGRVTLPLIGAMELAGLSENQAARAIAERYASVLRDPIVEVRATGYGSQQILVGGEVGSPGLYPLGDRRMGVLEAVMLAGGLEDTARTRRIVVLRRTEAGRAMLRTVDLDAVLSGEGGDTLTLARHDIVFVPRSRVAEFNLFVEQYVTNIVPFNQAFGYALADAAISGN